MDNQATIIEQLNAARRMDAAKAQTGGREATGPPAALPAAAGSSATGSILLGAAKDLLDWVVDFSLIGEIPFVGQIPGILFSLLILHHLWSQGFFKRVKNVGIYVGVGLILDNLPLFINNLPFSSLAIWLVRRAAQRARRQTLAGA